MSKLLSVCLSALCGLVLMGTASAVAQSAPPAQTGTGLGVITAVSASPTRVTTSFFFTGTSATGFVLAVPRHATLSSLVPAQIARDISLTTLAGTRVHYIILSARPDYLAITLHSPQPDLRLVFSRTLFRFSTAESRQISAHAVRSVRMGIAFSGGPTQLVASKFAFSV